VTTPRTAPSPAASGAKPEPTHPCQRCGAPIPIDRGLCERCNPLGLRDSSSSQVHAIAIGGIALFVVILAVAGRLALSGIGPFTATIANVVPAQQGLDVTLTLRNTGSSSGQTTCHISDPADRTSNQGAYVLSPSVAAGQTVTFTKHVTELGTTTKPLEVECPTP
jgi:predicted nucleic acid-binding Zn ribbon protein